MGIDWGTVVIGLVCTCIGLWFGWGIYHGKVETLKLELKVLKRELSAEKSRSEAYGKAADEWRRLAYRHGAGTDGARISRWGGGGIGGCIDSLQTPIDRD